MADTPANPPPIAHKQPIPVDVEAGKSYWWCTCGQSKAQPFCDGSHAGSTFSPQEYVADTTRKIFFCTCKQTAKPPFCDGAHNKL